MNEVAEKAKKLLVEKFDVLENKITPAASFIKDLGFDSLDFVELIMEFEQAFNIAIPDEEGEKIQTFGEAVDYIKSKIK